LVKFPKIERLFFNILTYSFLLPILFFSLFFSKLKSKRIAIAVVIYSAIIFLFLFFDDFLNRNFRHVYSILYTTIEYSCFAFVISQVIQKKSIRILILCLSILFIIFEIVYLLIIRFNTMDSLSIGVETILILLYTFYLFYEQFQKAETEYIYNTYWFWFIVGIIFYLSSSFFFNILADNNPQTKRYWFLTLIFETIKNILFVLGIIFLTKEKIDKKRTTSIPYLDLI
jgi:hypothetical protein